jgi:hypothetical protein
LPDPEVCPEEVAGAPAAPLAPSRAFTGFKLRTPLARRRKNDRFAGPCGSGSNVGFAIVGTLAVAPGCASIGGSSSFGAIGLGATGGGATGFGGIGGGADAVATGALAAPQIFITGAAGATTVFVAARGFATLLPVATRVPGTGTSLGPDTNVGATVPAGTTAVAPVPPVAPVPAVAPVSAALSIASGSLPAGLATVRDCEDRQFKNTIGSTIISTTPSPINAPTIGLRGFTGALAFSAGLATGVDQGFPVTDSNSTGS